MPILLLEAPGDMRLLQGFGDDPVFWARVLEKLWTKFDHQAVRSKGFQFWCLPASLFRMYLNQPFLRLLCWVLASFQPREP